MTATTSRTAGRRPAARTSGTRPISSDVHRLLPRPLLVVVIVVLLVIVLGPVLYMLFASVNSYV
jgi:multiple sugar transport system permease protein